MSSGGLTPAGRILLTRPDVSTLRTKHGAWVGVATSSFTVKGGSAHQVVSALLSRSDGSRTDHELLEEFPARSRPAVARILDALVARRCVTVLDAPLSQQTDARGAASQWLIPYLSQLTDQPVRALDRLRATSLHLHGRPAWLDRLRRLLEEVPLCGLETEFHPVSAEGTGAAPRWENAGLVVIDADGLPYEHTLRLQDALLERGVPHGIVGEVHGRRWILWSDASTTGCWECLCGYGRTQAPSPGPSSPAAAAPAGPASLAVDDAAAAALIHAVHLRGAGLGGRPEAAAAVSMPLTTDVPTVQTHPAWAAAGCRCRRAVPPPDTDAVGDDPGEVLVRRNIVSPEDDSRLDDVHERIIDTLRGWTDEFIGPFRYLDGGDLPQVPFGRARSTSLVGLAGACRVHELTTATLSSREAIYQAALNTLEGYAPPGAAAGWSLNEALYRALLKRSLARPADTITWTPLTEDDLGHDECAGYGRYIRRAVTLGTEVWEWTGARLEDGVHRVTGRTGGRPEVRGAGACYAEAVSMALLGLVNDEDAAVLLNPHFRTWPQVWQHLDRPTYTEVTAHTVPFAQGKARLVEVR
ncbi:MULTISPECIES: hypothetical protein [Streptomyces]|uniref:hypothetical protein n=1 Tax=Streptomyces TaxID=1883 RepID=UPI000517693B|nr:MULTISPECIES: hypothetical protein [Streptomyces]MDX2918173.1 hypothetical protein [Streptomyces sp. NE06-03C]